MNKKGFFIIIAILAISIIVLISINQNIINEEQIDYSKMIVDTKIRLINYEIILNQSINDCNWKKPEPEIINCVQQKSSELLTKIFSDTQTNCVTNTFNIIDSNYATTIIHCQTNINLNKQSFLLDLNKNILLKNYAKNDDIEDPSPSEPEEPDPENCFDIQTNPILLCSLSDLNRIRENLDGNYLVTNNINASKTKNWNNGKGWEPIGSQNNPFKGSLNGQNHTIQNLMINNLDNMHTGFIAYTNQTSEIINLNLEEINIIGLNNTGGLIGGNESKNISNININGKVTGNENVGGLIGVNYGIITGSMTHMIVNGNKNVGGLIGNVDWVGTIEKSFTTGSTIGNLNVGGLIGYNDFGEINQSFTTGDVNGGSNVGGLIGFSIYPNAKVINTYSTSRVNGDRVGGLIGTMQQGSKVINSYASGEVTTNATEYIIIGGLVGLRQLNEKIENSYWDINTTKQEASAGGEGKTTTQMKYEPTFETWDFENIWILKEDSYPTLKWQDD